MLRESELGIEQVIEVRTNQSNMPPVLRDERGRIRWSALNMKADDVIKVIDNEVEQLILGGIQPTQRGLRAADRSDLFYAIYRHYPGGLTALRVKYDLPDYRGYAKDGDTVLAADGSLLDKRGRKVWRKRGNIDYEDELLAIRTIQSIFLARFPEFNVLFPREKDDKIAENSEEEAKKFISKNIGTRKQFNNTFGSRAARLVFFNRSFRIALKKTFSLWGINYEYELAPEGWMVCRTLSTRLHIHEITIYTIANRFRKSHPEWFKKYLDTTSRECEHYSAELITIIEEELARYPLPPQGWNNTNQLRRKLGVKREGIEVVIDKLEQDHPDWFKKYRSKGGITTFYSPEVTAIISSMETVTLKRPTKDWITTQGLASRVRVSAGRIEAIAEKYREKHPGWIIKYRSRGELHDHYSPDLVTIITEEVGKYNLTDNNWSTVSNLSKQLRRTIGTIRSVAAQYRASHPEWFEEYHTQSGVREHYAPQLVEEIKKELGKEDRSADLMEQKPRKRQISHRLETKIAGLGELYQLFLALPQEQAWVVADSYWEYVKANPDNRMAIPEYYVKVYLAAQGETKHV